MTILATHFSVVLGAWRIRLRLDIDEPREDALDDATPTAPIPAAAERSAGRASDRVAPWGRG